MIARVPASHIRQIDERALKKFVNCMGHKFTHDRSTVSPLGESTITLEVVTR